MSKIAVVQAGIVAAALFATASASHAGKILDTSPFAINSPSSSHFSTPLLSTGFESPFTAGPITGQQGWTTFSANANTPAISTAHPASGSQHLRNSKGPGTSSSLNGAFSPNLGPQPAGHYLLSVDFASNDAGGADHMLIGQAPSQGFLTFRMHFDWQGRIMVLDWTSPSNQTLVFRDTGHTWQADGQYRNVTVEVNHAANSMKYYFNNILVWTSVGGVFAGTSIEQVILAGDNFYTTGGWGDWDNLNVIPGPGALCLLAVGGLLGGRRRRN